MIPDHSEMRKAFRGDLPQQIQSKVLNDLASSIEGIEALLEYEHPGLIVRNLQAGRRELMKARDSVDLAAIASNMPGQTRSI